MKKYWLGGAGVLAVAVAVGLVFLVSNLNDLVAKIVEDEGSEATATEVAVSGVDISLREGRAEMAGLTVASPGEFAARHAFSLGGIAVDIDIESLRSDPIVIEEIRVQAPVVNAEIHRDGTSNITALQKNVQQYAARFAGDGGRDASGGAAKDQKRLRIKRFVFEMGRIGVDASDLGLEPRTLELPAIRLDDIGGPEGALPQEIARAVLGALTRQATTTIAQAEVKERTRKEVAEQVDRQVKNLLGKVGG
jgi:uncharacterized protein involved in outer membrane biogenesis